VLWELVMFLLKAIALVWALQVVAFVVAVFLYPRATPVPGGTEPAESADRGS
jgi:hypothetical protein